MIHYKQNVMQRGKRGTFHGLTGSTISFFFLPMTAEKKNLANKLIKADINLMLFLSLININMCYI